MENRRRHYRHVLTPQVNRIVELTARAAKPLRGELVDLSVGGMSVRLLDPAVVLRPHERYRAQLALEGNQSVAVDAEVVHGASDPRAYYGMHFLPLAEVVATEKRERRLWAFLLDQQFRERRERGATSSRGGASS